MTTSCSLFSSSSFFFFYLFIHYLPPHYLIPYPYHQSLAIVIIIYYSTFYVIIWNISSLLVNYCNIRNQFFFFKFSGSVVLRLCSQYIKNLDEKRHAHSKSENMPQTAIKSFLFYSSNLLTIPHRQNQTETTSFLFTSLILVTTYLTLPPVPYKETSGFIILFYLYYLIEYLKIKFKLMILLINLFISYRKEEWM